MKGRSIINNKYGYKRKDTHGCVRTLNDSYDSGSVWENNWLITNNLSLVFWPFMISGG